MKAVYQGIRGAYSEVALRRRFGPRVRALGLALSEQVFDAVESGRADLGMLPVENTIAGNVAVNSDLFYKRDHWCPGKIKTEGIAVAPYSVLPGVFSPAYAVNR